MRRHRPHYYVCVRRSATGVAIDRSWARIRNARKRQAKLGCQWDIAAKFPGHAGLTIVERGGYADAGC